MRIPSKGKHSCSSSTKIINYDKKVEELANDISTEFKNSKKVYVENNNGTVKVPMREIKLSYTSKPDGVMEQNSLLESMILLDHGEI